MNSTIDTKQFDNEAVSRKSGSVEDMALLPVRFLLNFFVGRMTVAVRTELVEF